ncbi:YibE/F family protein [Selenomonas bovis]|nr:YibE/F family protein [Selenomonas bovis]
MAATLILAVFGGSLGAWVLDYVYDLPLLQLMNSNGLDIVIMQGLSGGIGVILTVPLAAFSAARLLSRKAPGAPRP